MHEAQGLEFLDVRDEHGHAARFGVGFAEGGGVVLRQTLVWGLPGGNENILEFCMDELFLRVQARLTDRDHVLLCLGANRVAL